MLLSRVRAVFLLVLLSVFAIACGSPDGEQEGVVGLSCSVPADCGDGLTCGLEGVCVAIQSGQSATDANVFGDAQRDPSEVDASGDDGSANPCSQDNQCDDGHDCTKDLCTNGSCQHVIDSKHCLIDDTCVKAGQEGPGICLICQPLAKDKAWTLNVGGSCDDNQPCTVDDVCTADAKCKGTAKADCCETDQDCDQSKPCKKATCDLSGNTCVYTVQPGCCASDADCTGQAPACKTFWCNPAFGTCDLKLANDGTTCDDGDGCTEPDTCTTGYCVGSAKTCDDGNACTADSCAAGQCVNTALQGCCLSGSCCDTKLQKVKAQATPCGTTTIETQYRCMGADIEVRTSTLGCDGTSNVCSQDVTNAAWTDWKVSQTCPKGQQCQLDGQGIATCATPAKPDLVPQTPKASKTVFNAAEAGSVSVVTNNEGKAPAPSHKLELRWSADSTISTGDLLLKTVSVPSIQAGSARLSKLTFSVPASAKPGTYYLGLWSDRSNVVSESNESNNISIVAVTVGGDATKLPDLKPLNVQTNSKSVTPGSTVYVTGTVQNSGAQSAGAFVVRWVLSKNAGVDAGDTSLKTISKLSLAAGAQTTLNTSFVIPKATAPGTYYLGVWVDASNSVAESNEANNTASFVLPISTSSSQADLTNTKGKLSSTTVKAGASVIYMGSIKNNGAQNAGAFKIEWWLSTNSVISTGDKNLKSLSKSSLGAGKSTSASTSILIPATTKPGTYYLAAWIDRANAVSESNTVNNKLVLKLTVTGASSTLPDLTATSGKLSKVSAKPGDTIVYSGVVKNQGQGNSGAYAVEWRWSTNSTITTIDKLLKSSTRPSIQGGSSQSVMNSLQIPANTTAGTYYVGFWIDRTGQVQESDETNNIQVLKITVTQGGTSSKLPDLTHVNGKVNSTTIQAGKALVYTGSVRNQGNATAAGSEVEWRLSTNTAITSIDKLLGTRTLGSLAAGSSASNTKLLVIPATTAPGTYYLGIWVDRKGAVQESDETNNIETIKLTVTSNSSKQPDLAHVGPKLSNTFVVAGASINFKGSINNQGASSAGPYQVSWRLTKSATFATSAPLLKTLTKPSLNAGGTTSNLTTLTVPANTAPGSYYVAVMLDSAKKIAESSETNNFAYIKITVIAKSTGPKPDLAHEGSKLSSVSATAGGLIVYQGSIKNIGNDKAPTFVVEYRLSSDDAISVTDTLLSAKTVSGLTAGGTVSAQLLLKIPSNTKPGAYTIGVWIDPKGQVNESQKANNIAKVPLQVLGTMSK